MKKLFLLALLSLVTLTAFAQEDLREVDLRIRGVGSGTSYAVVIKRLGNALRAKKERVAGEYACSGQDETYLYLDYAGLKISLLGNGKGQGLSVYSFEAISSKWTATSGVRIGNTTEEVRAKFGLHNSSWDGAGQLVLSYVTKGNLGGVNFYFVKNRLVKMVMQETLC
jgi:hypothetical protein